MHTYVKEIVRLKTDLKLKKSVPNLNLNLNLNPKNRLPLVIAGSLCITPLCHASVESSLLGLKSVLLGSILPVFAVLGLAFSAFSFITGNPDAKKHLGYAVTGAVILFGAQSIVDLIERVVQ